MAFYNKKEDVIDIELTSYGKRMLADGTLKPTYYVFFDEDIIYDAAWGGDGDQEPKEAQNDIQPRILEAARSINRVNYAGVETTIKQAIREYRENSPDPKESAFINIQAPVENSFVLQNRLGTSSPTSEYLPAWSIAALRNQMTGSTIYLQGEHGSEPIPQLNIEIEGEVRIIQDVDSYDLSTLDEYELIATYDNGSALALKIEDTILDIFENNGVFERENFDIATYRVTSSFWKKDSEGNNIQPIQPLENHYPSTPYFFLNEDLAPTEIPDLNPNYIGYFLDILVDNEIGEDVLCKLKIVDPAKGLYDKRGFVCEDTEEKAQNEDVYAIQSPDVCED